MCRPLPVFFGAEDEGVKKKLFQKKKFGFKIFSFGTLMTNGKYEKFVFWSAYGVSLINIFNCQLKRNICNGLMQSLQEYKTMNVERQATPYFLVEPQTDSIHIVLWRSGGFTH